MRSQQAQTAIQNEQTYIMQTYLRPDVVFERGEGAFLYDTEGNRYLDFVAGIGVNALGYGDPDVLRVINEQASRLIHVSNLFHTIPGGTLAKELIEHSHGFDRVFFSNSGAEAIEGSLKLARKYARDYYGEGKTTFVSFEGSFHGRTMGAVAITSREAYRLPFHPVMPHVRFATLNDPASFDGAMGDDVCGVVVEPVQGEGGLNVAQGEFLRHVRDVCTRHGALMIVDEIQCGMGRTGTLWAHEQAGVRPDIMTLAKPLAGGLPIGAILASQAVADSFAPGNHGTTFGGGPLITAVANVVFGKVKEPTFLEHVRHIGAYLEQQLQQLIANHPDTIVETRGRGLMRGLLVTKPATDIRQACYEQWLLVATAGPDVVRLLPPLIVDESHVNEAMTLLDRALRAG
jgi:acetylornithine/N-succinyldiaminopimelate aminotransferase